MKKQRKLEYAEHYVAPEIVVLLTVMEEGIASPQATVSEDEIIEEVEQPWFN